MTNSCDKMDQEFCLSDLDLAASSPPSLHQLLSLHHSSSSLTSPPPSTLPPHIVPLTFTPSNP